jgi:hypothetical protein
MLKNNPAFKEVFTHDIYRFYVPTEHTKYHTSRYLEANNQMIFATNGATKETLVAHLDKIIEICNAQTPIATTRTDIAALCNSLIYRTKKPVDEKCAIRLGALLCFMEYEHEDKTVSEDPNMTEGFWLAKKMDLAMNNPTLYTFFLTLGVDSTELYKEALGTSRIEDYLATRKEMLASLLPTNLQALASL